ncbi:hypothetical protein Tco_0543896 [Tanacetum coccineum]
MTTLAKHIIVAGAENRPPMLEKSLYDSWAICICLFIKGKKSGRMMLDLIDEDNLFDKFTSVQGETLYEYYWRFSQLINDMHTIGITMQQVQVNTKFLNALPPEWSKFITDVKLAKILYTTNYDQLYAYLTEFPQLDFGLTVPTFQQGENLIECINKVMTFLSVVASRFPPSNNQLRTSFNPRNQVTIQDGRVIVQQVQGRQTQSFAGTRNKGIATTSRGNYATGQAKEKLMLVEAQEADLDAYDLDCNDISLAKAVLMANLSSCDSDVLYEIPYSDTYPNDMINQDDTTSSAPTDLLVLSLVEQITDHVANLDKENSQMDDLIRNRNAKFAAFQQEIDTLKQNLSNHVKEKESLSTTLTIFKTKSKEKESKYIHAILADEITEVQTVFNQMEVAVDQCSVNKNAFEIQIKQLSIDNDQLLNQIMSQEIVHITVNSVDILNVNKSCVDECNKCLELETELLKKKDLIEKDDYDKLLKSYSTLEKHCISLELATQLNQEIFQKDNFCANQNAPIFNQLFEINEMKAQSQEKNMFIRKLKDMIKSLSGKDSVENVKKDIDEIETINIELEHNLNAQLQEKVFAIAALKNKLRKLKGKILKNNKDTHEVYLEKTIENTDTLRGLELLVYVSKTCLSLTKPCEKLVVATPMNKDKKVRFVKPITSLSNIPKQTDSLKTKDSNKPLFTSIGVNTTTSASRSKPSGNTKKNRISRPSSSNQKNKVEEHLWKVKSSLNKTNSISEPISNAHVKHSVRNAKFDFICAICNKCLFNANHAMCLIDYVNDVNVRSKSKSKRSKMRKVWKPTSKVFTEIGYS